ncbi:PorT family protein [Paracrocinitomix mangrovi]|uniref:outer membrane beta-barrel protein n=1 Tax=Paracrocinitomix mangrovi TaxID=2862509 RepID=UPI001C8DCE4D|nr:outer membrane beta-barrel protein [Paracrocinitomix mangrovi]UKN02092.1 PorT family protein [Paracrocinitomix mangrovi]
MIRITILSFALTLTNLVSAQQHIGGIKLLPGVTNYWNSPDELSGSVVYDPRFTFNFGAQYIYEVGESPYGLETGLYWFDRGTVNKGITSTGGDIALHSYSLGIPVLFRYDLDHLYFSAGPSIEVKMRNKYVYKETGTVTKIGLSSDFANNIRYGIDLNVGGKLNITEKIGLFAELSFHYSHMQYSEFYKKFRGYTTYELGIGANYRF